MTDDVDTKDFFILDRHANATFHLTGGLWSVAYWRSKLHLLELGIRKVAVTPKG